jgi:hypothetical protein
VERDVVGIRSSRGEYPHVPDEEGVKMGTSLPVISNIASLAGTAISAYGTYRGGQEQKRAYEYNARVAQAESVVARQKAEREEEISRLKVRRLMGTQRAMFAAAGVDIGSGTPLSIMVDTAVEGEKEAQYIKWGGATEEARFLNEAKLQKMYGGIVGRTGRTKALSQFATGLGKIGMQSYKPGATPKTNTVSSSLPFGGWD